MTDLARLRQIAEYQQESGFRVEYPASTILALLDELEAERRRTEFLLRHFTRQTVWDRPTIDEAIRQRAAKGFDRASECG